MLSLIYLIIILLISWAWGIKVLKFFKVSFQSHLEEFCFSVGFAFGFYTLLTFLLGILSLLYSGVFYAFFAALLLLTLREIKQIVNKILGNRFFVFSWLLLIVILLYTLSLIVALAPPTGMDTTAQHFAVSKLFIQAHKIYLREDTPVHKAGGIHMLYVIGMLLHGETLASLISYSITIISIISIYSMTLTIFDKTVSVISAFIFATAPITVVFSGYAYTDNAVGFYFLLSIYSLLKYTYKNEANSQYLSAIFCGLAISTKRTGFVAIVIFLTAFLYLIKRKRLYDSVLTSIIFVICGSFWYIWSYCNIGSFFGTLGVIYSGNKPQAVNNTTITEVILSLFTFLKNIFTMGEYGVESIGPVILFLLICYLFFTPKQKISQFMFYLLILEVTTYWLVIIYCFNIDKIIYNVQARFFSYFILATTAPLCGYTFTELIKKDKALKTVLYIALLLPVLPTFIIESGKAFVDFKAAMGLESRDNYLKKKIETYEVTEYANKHLLENEKILFMGYRPYYLDLPYIKIVPGPEPYLGALTKEGIIANIKKEGIKYVIFEPGVGGYPSAFKSEEDFFTPEIFKLVYKTEKTVGGTKKTKAALYVLK